MTQEYDTKDTDQMSWEAVSADLTQEWSQMRQKGEHENSNNDNRKTKNHRIFCANKSKNHSAGLKCNFCGGKRNVGTGCSNNSESSSCNLPEKLRE